MKTFISLEWNQLEMHSYQNLSEYLVFLESFEAENVISSRTVLVSFFFNNETQSAPQGAQWAPLWVNFMAEAGGCLEAIEFPSKRVVITKQLSLNQTGAFFQFFFFCSKHSITNHSPA